MLFFYYVHDVIFFQLSIVASAVWGSYLVCTSISYFTTGILHYLIYNVLRRATTEQYARAYHAAQFEIIGRHAVKIS